MGKSWIYCLSLLLLIGCKPEHKWYKKSFSKAEKSALAPALRNGVSYYYQGTVAEQFQIKGALSLDSTNGDFWREMGTARVKRGLASEMHYYYAKAAALKPDPWLGFRAYLYLYFYRDYPRAIQDFNRLDSITGSIGHSQAQDHDYMRAVAYYGLKDYPQAIRYARKYIERLTSEIGAEWVDANAHLYLALSLEKNGAPWQEVQAELQKMLKIYPESADAYFHLARLSAQRQRFWEARKFLLPAEAYFQKGYFHQRPYVEVLDQLFPQDFKKLSDLLTARGA